MSLFRPGVTPCFAVLNAGQKGGGMSWLDSVLVAPTIGLGIKLPLRVDADKGRYLASFLDFISSKGEAKIALEGKPEKNPLAVKLAGHTISLSNERLAVSYGYEVKTVVNEKGLPSFALPEVIPYSELLCTVKSYFLEAAKCLEPAGGTTYSFIGIVAATSLNAEALPPGVERFIEYISGAWEGLVAIDMARLTVKLSENSLATDRCHHTCKFDTAKREDGFTLKLDWQRVYKTESPLRLQDLSQNLDSCIHAFLDYCERFGEGNLNYDQRNS